MNKPKKWTEVYPYGTKEGDEEAKFFRALARHPKFEYRSTGAIIKATGLSRQRVEEIVDKYVNKISPPLLFPHTSNDDHWGYWERCQDRLKDDFRDISKKDKDNRVDKHIAGTPSMVGNAGAANPVLQSSYDRKLQIMAQNPQIMGIAVPDEFELDQLYMTDYMWE